MNISDAFCSIDTTDFTTDDEHDRMFNNHLEKGEWFLNDDGSHSALYMDEDGTWTEDIWETF